ncbi:MAG: cbb3-type cytochrome c oxidase subunit 3 [Parvularculaceae bacterium]
MYETLSNLAQTLGLLLFVLAFAMVLYYALRPGNKKTFDHAANLPLNEEEPSDEQGP